jgi:hypothetical protein
MVICRIALNYGENLPTFDLKIRDLQCVYFDNIRAHNQKNKISCLNFEQKCREAF